MKPTSRYRRTSLGRRSGFEDEVMEQLQKLQIEALYEPFFVRYQHYIPRRYTPDIVLPNGILIELKGYFDAADRTKHLLIKQDYPALDIRFVFQRSKNKLSLKSKMTYADWCVKRGFLYADKTIQTSWLEEPPLQERLAAIKNLGVPLKKSKI